MRPLHVSAHRLLAAGALLLASCLEICGCNTMPGCQRVLGQQISSLDLQTLVERCTPCLTARELDILKRGQGRFAMAGTTTPLRLGETIREALHENAGPSFYDAAPYDAAANTDPPASAPQVSDFRSPETTPYLPRALPAAPASALPAGLDSALPAEFRSGPWPIPESVLLLYRAPQPEGTRRKAPIATAFVLSVPGRGGRAPARFLVTARHVVDPVWAYCSEQNPAAIQVRLNRRTGGVGYETVPLADPRGGPRYLVPSDPTADIAVLRLDPELVPNIERYKFVDTPSRLLPTESELSDLSSRQRDDARDLPGQTVTTANLRAQVPADLSAFPTSQSGVLVSTANEPVNIQCGNRNVFRPLRVWFIGASVERGVSGAPVYTTLARDGETAPSTVLLGVQSIAWPERGVAGVTPASALAGLIDTALANRNRHHNKGRNNAPEYAQKQPVDLHANPAP